MKKMKKIDFGRSFGIMITIQNDYLHFLGVLKCKSCTFELHIGARIQNDWR